MAPHDAKDAHIQRNDYTERKKDVAEKKWYEKTRADFEAVNPGIDGFLEGKEHQHPKHKSINPDEYDQLNYTFSC
jgi:hypothetical protein